MGGLRSILICGAIVASTLQAASQAVSTDWEVWLCSVHDPDAGNPDYIFDVDLRVNDKDFRVNLELPNRSETVHYTLVENDERGINAIARVPNVLIARRYGIRLLLLNKKDGGFRAGTMAIGGSNTQLIGTCKRK